ncbi:MAG: hypothetical protein Q7R67_01390 [bacterium]|nr:hypothetical protein [bacterium]
MDGQRTKKMVGLDSEIQQLTMKMGELNGLHARTQKFEPQTEAGKKAREDALTQIHNEMDTLQNDIRERRDRFEVATVEFLCGKDAEMAEPTPGEALARAV